MIKYIWVFILFLSSCKRDYKIEIGKYKKIGKNDFLYIYENKNYKVNNFDTTFEGKWSLIIPNEIGFKDWVTKNEGVLNYNFAFIGNKKIIFNLDNEEENYIFLSDLP